MKVSIVWFRRDLRLEDNAALAEALAGNHPVLPIFIFDQQILQHLHKDDARVNFIYDTLKGIDERLREQGSSLLIKIGEPEAVWKELIAIYDIAQVYLNKDYEPYALERDTKIVELLNIYGIPVAAYKDQVIFEEEEVMKDDGKPYTVFTPYKRKWLSHFKAHMIEPWDSFPSDNFHQGQADFPDLKTIGFMQSDIKVKPYTLAQIGQYAETRNLPAVDSTSYLSPHLRFGTVSVREIFRQLKPDDEVFMSELIWREFFMQILYHFPRVVNENFKTKYDGVAWRNDEKEFKKWCEGRTGYPMVDAGMRQLNQTGYMHNRVRMVVASFLCKHLLIDWRWGEAYFAEKLLDFELSSNNGNWQWAAGTGCDASPYFRVFNPESQLKKFDKDFKYIRQWVPEYGTPAYPSPMVEHAFARKRALETYKMGLD